MSLVGYYLAALLIDHKSYGRVRMQQVGFAMDFILFLFGAIFFESLQRPGTNIKIFQAMFYASSFFQQFGPNCVTFLVAAEVFPTSIRSTAHGVSAAIGKLGALAPTILYHYIDNREQRVHLWPTVSLTLYPCRYQILGCALVRPCWRPLDVGIPP